MLDLGPLTAVDPVVLGPDVVGVWVPLAGLLVCGAGLVTGGLVATRWERACRPFVRRTTDATTAAAAARPSTAKPTGLRERGRCRAAAARASISSQRSGGRGTAAT